MRITCTLLLLMIVTAPFAGAQPARDRIVIDLKREWHFSGFSPGKVKVAFSIAITPRMMTTFISTAKNATNPAR